MKIALNQSVEICKQSPTQIANAIGPSAGGSFFGAVRSYSCNTGFMWGDSEMGAKFITCLDTGIWSTIAIQCFSSFLYVLFVFPPLNKWLHEGTIHRKQIIFHGKILYYHPCDYYIGSALTCSLWLLCSSKPRDVYLFNRYYCQNRPPQQIWH